MFLKESVKVLTECRRTLMYSYVFANSIKANAQKVIFEHNQENLESDVETLSHSLGSGFHFKNVEEMIEWKQTKLDNLQFMAKHRATTLLDHVKQANKLGEWDYKPL